MTLRDGVVRGIEGDDLSGGDGGRRLAGDQLVAGDEDPGIWKILLVLEWFEKYSIWKIHF